MSADYFADRSHVLISGVTGARTEYGGKTALANWWASTWGVVEFDLVCFLNFKQDSHIHGTRVESLEELASEMADGQRHFNIVPRTDDWEGFHASFKTFVASLPDDMSKLVVHDEAPEYDDDSLRWFVRVAGNGHATKSLVLAQAPGDMNTTIRNQTIPCWIGPSTGQNSHYFTAQGYKQVFETHILDQEPYHWTVVLGPDPEHDVDTYQPVPSEYA